jgi:hypothetical protein
VTEARKRVWDVWLGIAAPILTVVGILVGIHQFNAGEAHKNTIEFERKLWLERLDAYRSIAQLSGKIVTHANDKDFGDLVQQFTAAYWGTMIFVEDKDVEQSMIDFNVEIREFQDGFSSVPRLKERADELIKACRQSLEKDELKTETPPTRYGVLNVFGGEASSVDRGD